MLNIIHRDDTIHLLQNTTSRHAGYNQTKQIQVEVTKSFTLKVWSLKASMDMEHNMGVDLHGIRLIFGSNCSEHCSVTIDKSQFSYSFIEFNNLDVWIKDTQFMDSFLTVQAQSENHGHGFNMKIQDSEFKCNFPVKSETKKTSMNNKLCKQLNCICLSGNWNSIEIARSNMEGNRESQESGVEVVHANIQMLSLVNDQISSMFSAVVIWSSGVGIFNVTESVFLGNRDGIDIGQGVRYMLVSRSQMNDTGSWFGHEQGFEQCYSALKGIALSLKVEDSVFAHNWASGMNCKGAALSIRSNIYATPLLESNLETFDKGKQVMQTIEVDNSVFHENIVENCSVGLGYDNLGGGAITVYGALMMIKIMASTFVRNEASKGAGLFVGLSDRWPANFSQKSSTGQVLSSMIIIDTCTFNENIAEYGGGLTTEFIDSTIDTSSSHSILIKNSSFFKNNASSLGAGALFYYANVSINNGVTFAFQLNNTEFKENINTGRTHPHGNGGGVGIEFKLLSLKSGVSVKTTVNNCSFTSNNARVGAGLYTAIRSCSVDSNSTIISEVLGSTFTSLRAKYGGGISTSIHSSLVHTNSLIILQLIGSNATSNTATLGAGIYTYIRKCALHYSSSIILHTTDSNFTANTATDKGAGIYTEVYLLSLKHSHSTLVLHVTGSIFTFNKAKWGAGVYTGILQCSFHSENMPVASIS